VINIASIDGVSVNPQETYSYAASKAGLIHLTKRMALRLARDHIMVSAIAPGAFASDMNRVARDQSDEVAKRVPAGRVGRADDMAGAGDLPGGPCRRLCLRRDAGGRWRGHHARGS
jgi:NAD(P)-dependent dehydrogenase (short-subunit alcohol dehydrogenase family)